MERPGHEIVGQRLVGAMAAAEIVDMWCRITSKIGAKIAGAGKDRRCHPP